MEIQLKHLIEVLARYLADHPEQIRVTEIHAARTSILQLRMAKDDAGHIIGKDGQNAEALRTILGATATRLRKKVILEILV